MAFKQFPLDAQITITVYKRRASRNLKLSITPGGKVRVSIPSWTPYVSGLNFAKSRYDWIKSQLGQRTLLLPDQAIGKAHHLRFIANDSVMKPTAKVVSSDIRVSHPVAVSITSISVQKAAETASIRALRIQAETLLPNRLASLASKHGFQYRQVSVKRLKSRWGSCDQQGNIVLNLFLMQLPWECIDYVLMHELVHTKVLRHGPDFWQSLIAELPNAKLLRRQISSYQPVLRGSTQLAVA